MSALIKSGGFSDIGVVHPVTSFPASVSPVEQERDRLGGRIAFLEAELGQRDDIIAEVRAAAVKAFEDGKVEGRKLGVADADRRENERLSLLEKGVRQALSDLKSSLLSLERLAALLARECLDIMLGDPEHRTETLRRLIAAQMPKLEKSLVVAITVSNEDFQSADALDAV